MHFHVKKFENTFNAKFENLAFFKNVLCLLTLAQKSNFPPKIRFWSKIKNLAIMARNFKNILNVFGMQIVS